MGEGVGILCFVCVLRRCLRGVFVLFFGFINLVGVVWLGDSWLFVLVGLGSGIELFLVFVGVVVFGFYFYVLVGVSVKRCFCC